MRLHPPFCSIYRDGRVVNDPSAAPTTSNLAIKLMKHFQGNNMIAVSGSSTGSGACHLWWIRP
jgi:hypothetical protein